MCVPCVKVGKKQGYGKGLLEVKRDDRGKVGGKDKCDEVRVDRGAEAGPCRGLHGGNWNDGGDEL